MIEILKTHTTKLSITIVDDLRYSMRSNGDNIGDKEQRKWVEFVHDREKMRLRARAP